MVAVLVGLIGMRPGLYAFPLPWVKGGVVRGEYRDIRKATYVEYIEIYHSAWKEWKWPLGDDLETQIDRGVMKPGVVRRHAEAGLIRLFTAEDQDSIERLHLRVLMIGEVGFGGSLAEREGLMRKIAGDNRTINRVFMDDDQVRKPEDLT